MHVIHVLCGFFVLLVTLIWTLRILNYFNWKVNDNLHSVLGIIACCFTVVVAVSGSVTWGLMFKSASEWKPREAITQAGKLHRWSGYLMLALGNLTAFSGLWHYQYDIVMDYEMAPLGLISLLLFTLLIILFEICHCRANFRSDMVVDTPTNTAGR